MLVQEPLDVEAPHFFCGAICWHAYPPFVDGIPEPMLGDDEQLEGREHCERAEIVAGFASMNHGYARRVAADATGWHAEALRLRCMVAELQAEVLKLRHTREGF